MNYLLTGATGFIGKHILLKLIKKDKVIVISRRSRPKNIQYIQNIIWIKNDLAKKKFIFKNKIKIDCIIHCLGNHSDKDEKNLLFANELSLINLIKSIKNNFKKLIYISSHTIYGNVNKVNISEKTKKLNILTPYACSKINSENWIKLYAKIYQNKSISILRFPGFIEGKGLIGYILNQAKNNKTIKLYDSGNIKRDYLNIGNALNCISNTIKNSKKGINFYNIGSGSKVTTFKLANIIVKNMKSKSRIVRASKKGDLGNFVFDISKAKKLLNYKPVKLEKIILDYLNKEI